MAGGSAVGRQWVVVLHDGEVAIDWGDGLYQNVHDGRFLRFLDTVVSHAITNEELDVLKRYGEVDRYDDKTVFFIGLPSLERGSIE
jgi:hypothetical protein